MTAGGKPISITIEISVPYERVEGVEWPFPNRGLMLIGESAADAAKSIFDALSSKFPDQRRWDAERATSQVAITVRACGVRD